MACARGLPALGAAAPPAKRGCCPGCRKGRGRRRRSGRAARRPQRAAWAVASNTCALCRSRTFRGICTPGASQRTRSGGGGKEERREGTGQSQHPHTTTIPPHPTPIVWMLWKPSQGPGVTKPRGGEVRNGLLKCGHYTRLCSTLASQFYFSKVCNATIAIHRMCCLAF